MTSQRHVTTKLGFENLTISTCNVVFRLLLFGIGENRGRGIELNQLTEIKKRSVV